MLLLESTIGYLCLPRAHPPGGPCPIGTKVFDGGTSSSKKIKAKRIVSLRAASTATLAATKKRGNTTGNVGSKAGVGQGPLLGDDGDRTGRSPLSPHQRHPSSGRGGARQHDKPAETAAATAATRVAAASATAASLLLPWDGDSLASLLAAHRDVAAILLLSARNLKLETRAVNAEDQVNANLRVCISERDGKEARVRGSAVTESANAWVGDPGKDIADESNIDDDAENNHAAGAQQRRMLEQRLELLTRADDSLTVALAAAGCDGAPAVALTTGNALPSAPDPEVAGSGNERPSGVIAAGCSRNDGAEPFIRSRSPSRVGGATLPDDTGSLNPASWDPISLVTMEGVPPQDLASERDANQGGTSSTDETHQGPPGGGGRDGDGNTSTADTAVTEEQRRREDHGSAAPARASAVVAVVDSRTVAELYGMRCAAREGLGLVEDAFSDCLGALAAAPKAPKLWAKAAALALQAGSETDRSWDENGCKDGRGKTRKDVCVEWANEVGDVMWRRCIRQRRDTEETFKDWVSTGETGLIA